MIYVMKTLDNHLVDFSFFAFIGDLIEFSFMFHVSINFVSPKIPQEK